LFSNNVNHSKFVANHPGMQEGKTECLALGRNPGRGAIHFDNFFNGVITIFQIITLEGWADLCYQLQDSTGI